MVKWIQRYDTTLNIKRFLVKVARNQMKNIFIYMKALSKETEAKLDEAVKHRNSKKLVSMISLLNVYIMIHRPSNAGSLTRTVVLKWRELEMWEGALRKHRVNFISIHIVCTRFFSNWRDAKYVSKAQNIFMMVQNR